jgi:hypothetical protein
MTREWQGVAAHPPYRLLPSADSGMEMPELCEGTGIGSGVRDWRDCSGGWHSSFRAQGEIVKGL